MTLQFKIVPTSEGFLLIDIHTPIKKDLWVCGYWRNDKSAKYFRYDPAIIYDTYYEGRLYEVIASAFIKELPILDRESVIDAYERDRIEKLAEEHWHNQYLMAKSDETKPYVIEDFKAGYKSNPARYTEEQMRSAMNLAYLAGQTGSGITHKGITDRFQPQYTERFCEIEQIGDTIKVRRLI